MAADRWSVDRRKVVHETIGGEAILIHLELGNYYSLSATGAEVWDELLAGASEDELVSSLRSRYDAPAGDVEAAVSELLGQLRADDLISATAPAGGTHGAAATNGRAAANGGPRVPFEPPEFERYTDMQDFLLVDPIHDADEAGWPAVKPAD